MNPDEYAGLARRFAETDRRVNGEGGREANIAQLNRIEMLLGIGLAEFTRQKERPS